MLHATFQSRKSISARGTVKSSLTLYRSWTEARDSHNPLRSLKKSSNSLKFIIFHENFCLQHNIEGEKCSSQIAKGSESDSKQENILKVFHLKTTHPFPSQSRATLDNLKKNEKKDFKDKSKNMKSDYRRHRPHISSVESGRSLRADLTRFRSFQKVRRHSGDIVTLPID